nr:unnamed protein product [Spirometra erinaceieuropaei]
MLADKGTEVVVIGFGKPAECVTYSEKSLLVPYPLLPKWIRNSAYPDAEIQGNLLSFSKAPPKNQATFQCRYHHHNLSITKEFNFKVYEPWQILPAEQEAKCTILKFGEPYNETCSPKNLVHDGIHVTANFSDLYVERHANAELRLNVKGNQVTCNSPKKWACFTLTCNIFVDNIRLPPIRQTRCYIDMLNVDLIYKSDEGISPGETVSCVEPANIFLPGDAEWNGFRLQGKQTAQVPDQMHAASYLIGCEVRDEEDWARQIYNLPIIVREPEIHLSSAKVTVNEKFRCYGIGFYSLHYRYKVRNLKPYAYGEYCPAAERDDGILKFHSICPLGLQKIECTVHGDAEYGIPETSRVLEINLLDYDPILEDDDLVLTPVPILPLLMAWILWFCILFFNALFVAYLIKQNSLYRITQMQVMNRRRTGGTRLNRRMENLPFVYIQRSELDGQLFRRLRLLIDLYSGFLELGDRWFLLWTMNKKDIRLKLLKHFRDFLEQGERIGRRYVLSTYLKTGSTYTPAGQSSNFGPKSAVPRASVKK